jgi:hypothetical protein
VLGVDVVTATCHLHEGMRGQPLTSSVLGELACCSGQMGPLSSERHTRQPRKETVRQKNDHTHMK